MVQEDLHLPSSVSVANVLLDAAGPVYVVCGDLPSTPSTECSLDSNIAAVWPSALSGDSFVAPRPLGDVVNSINASLKLLGLPPQAALQNALKCTVAADQPPPAAPTAAATTPIPAATTPVTGPPTSNASPPEASTAPGDLTSPSPSTPAGPISTEPAGTPSFAPQRQQAAHSKSAIAPSFIGSISDEVPSGLVALQIVVAAILIVFLAGAWFTSGRLAWPYWRRRNQRP